jgi:hypothetical protein
VKVTFKKNDCQIVMRKKIILTGLLMGCASLACLISAEKSHVREKGNLMENRAKTYDHGGETSSEKNTANAPYDRNYLMKLQKLSREGEELERICRECRLVIDKAAIEDSVYDQYDNPGGRLDRYKIDLVVKKLFNSNNALNVNKVEIEKMKNISHVK